MTDKSHPEEKLRREGLRKEDVEKAEAIKATGYKTCSKCCRSHPVAMFSKNSKALSGLGCQCKLCVREHKETLKANDPLHYKKKGRECRISRRAHLNRYKEKYPIKVKVLKAFQNYVRDYEIPRGPCVICGAKVVHAHHSDYAKPLDVMWLCPIHHGAWHRLFVAINGDTELPLNAVEERILKEATAYAEEHYNAISWKGLVVKMRVEAARAERELMTKELESVVKRTCMLLDAETHTTTMDKILAVIREEFGV